MRTIRGPRRFRVRIGHGLDQREIETVEIRLRLEIDFELVTPDSDPRYKELWTLYHSLTERKGISIDYAKLDDSASPARIRLNSTVVKVAHDGPAASAASRRAAPSSSARTRRRRPPSPPYRARSFPPRATAAVHRVRTRGR